MMLRNLILSRRLREQILIGDAVVTVVGLTKGRVKLSVLADAGTPVHRGEVHVRKGGTIPAMPKRKVA